MPGTHLSLHEYYVLLYIITIAGYYYLLSDKAIAFGSDEVSSIVTSLCLHLYPSSICMENRYRVTHKGQWRLLKWFDI